MSCGADILCFADAGARVGSGHIFRVYPVVEALVQKGIFAQMVTPLREEDLASMGLGNTLSGSSGDFLRLAGECRRRAILWDSYRDRGDLVLAARGSDGVVFDDRCDPPPEVLVINASPSARSQDYPKNNRLLLGPEYSSLHPAFAAARENFCVRKGMGRIFVALGGNDTEGKLPEVVRRLLDVFPSAELVVCGAPDAIIPDDRRVVRREWLTQNQIAGVMASCDLGVLAGGQMLVQAACVGLPVLALPQTENQRRHAEAWRDLGTLIVARDPDDLGLLEQEFSLRNRQGMSEAGRKQVDGRGAERIAGRLLESIRDDC